MNSGFRKFRYMAVLLAATFSLPVHAARAEPAKIPVRVVVVTTFEIGNDEGDQPGEFQHWVEKLPLPQVLPFPGRYRRLRYNPDLHVLGVVAGEGPTRMAATITALGDDPRFDLTHAYFLLAGIGGVDPNTGSVGSAVWAPHVVNGDVGHAIDPREIPADWPNGFTPIQGARPNPQPMPPPNSYWGDNLFTLRPSLVKWAYSQTRNVHLADTPQLAAMRERYNTFPAAGRAPGVDMGDTMAAGIFWVGGKMNAWAEGWVHYWTQGKGHFVTTAEEDAGFMEALGFLADAGKVDLNRVLVLRTASNFDMPPAGETPAQLLAAEADEKGFSGFDPSVAAAYTVGSVVVRKLAEHWNVYENRIP